jgi:transposase-like protein
MPNAGRRASRTIRGPPRHLNTRYGIDSLNARFRQATRCRGHFPNEQAALKIVYLAVNERRPNRESPTGRIHGWRSILNILAMTYSDRLRIE